MSKTLRPGQTGTVMIADLDAEAIVTRDLSNHARSKHAIEDYASAYAEGVKLPAVEVFLVDGRMVLVDGDHRVKARRTIDAPGVVATCVGEGSLEDALRYALKGTNRGHGLRLSPEDCRRRVFLALDSKIWDSPSANALGADLGISHHTASKYMGEWEAAQGVEPPAVRTDSKGRKQPARKPRKARDVGTANVDNDPATFDLANETASRPEPPVTDEAPLPFEPPDRPGEKVPGYGPALLEAAKRVREARIFALRSVPSHPSLVGVRQRFEQSMRQAQAALELAEPVPCDRCGAEGCERCNSLGWNPRQAVAR